MKHAQTIKRSQNVENSYLRLDKTIKIDHLVIVFLHFHLHEQSHRKVYFQKTSCAVTRSYKSSELLSSWHCVKSVRIPSFSGPYFLAFGLSISPYSVWMWENTDQKNCEYGHILRSVSYYITNIWFLSRSGKFICYNLKTCWANWHRNHAPLFWHDY